MRFSETVFVQKPGFFHLPLLVRRLTVVLRGWSGQSHYLAPSEGRCGEMLGVMGVK